MLATLPLLVLTLAAPADRWTEALVPRPRQLTFGQVVSLPPEKLTVEVLPAPGEAESYLLDTARDALVAAGAKPGEHGWLLVGTAQAMRGRLPGFQQPSYADLPNGDQAYSVLPQAGGGLVLCGATPLATLYAARTVAQLLGASKTERGFDVPQVIITDAPTIAERGFWGGNIDKDLDWFASRKFNLYEVHATLGFAADGTPTATMKPELLEAAAKRGIRIVPIIHHLEQLHSTGITKYYPEVDAGETESKNPGQRRMHLDSPKFREIVAKWFSDLGAYPQVTGVTVWLSEEDVHHPWVDTKTEPYVQEARIVQDAFALAQAKHPQLRLRLLTTQGSYKVNELVLAAARPGTTVIHYDGSRTYNSSRKNIIDPYFAEWAKDPAHRLGVCPQLCPDWRGVAPWPGADFVQARMRDFAAAGVQVLDGYIPPDRRFYDLMVEAAAEYAWNPESQEPRAFDRGFAVRHGFADPDAFAEWATALSPVAWDIYGSRVIVSWCYGASSPKAAAAGSLKLGQGIFAEVPDEARLTADRAAIEQAKALLPRVQHAHAEQVTAAIDHWQAMLTDLWRLNALLPKAKDLPAAERDQLKTLLADFDVQTDGTAKALRAWGEAVIASGVPQPGRWTDTLEAVQRQGTEMAAIAEKLGFPDARKAYRRAKIGAWKTDDFDAESPHIATYEVTDRLAGPGSYEAEFSYTSGLLGLVVSKVVLVTQQGDDPATRREVAVDEHRSHCGAWNEHNRYRLELKEHVPGTRYFLLATESGGDPKTAKDQRSTNGEVFFRKLER